MKRASMTAVVLAGVLGLVAGSPAMAGTDEVGKGVIVLNGQGNDLDAYSGNKPFKHQLVIQNHNDDPKGRDINAQICFFPDGKRFIAGEDTGQPDPPAGWGIFRLRGKRVGKLRAAQVGKLTPTYQNAGDNAENYGCGFLSDGRVLTTDIGNQAAGDPNGQLIVWFPPFDSRDVRYCKLDAKQVGKLQPTYQGSADNAENYGCGILSDGRVVTSDIGNQSSGDGDGQLIVWFPPFT